MFYREASVAILVYDITHERSFNELRNYWIQKVKKYSPENIILAIAANKSDLYEQEAVSEELGRQLAKEYNMIFVSVSAKNNSSIQELFTRIGAEYINRKNTDHNMSIQFSLNEGVERSCLRYENTILKKKKNMQCC